MRIEQKFPLECCEKCTSARPYTNEHKYYSYDEVIEQIVVLGCEHEQECRTIYNFLKEQIQKS